MLRNQERTQTYFPFEDKFYMAMESITSLEGRKEKE